MSYLTLHNFGLPTNAFSGQHQTNDLDKVAISIKGAIENRSFASIIGPRGVGKSKSVAAALPKNAQIVLPLSPDRERLRIGAIEDAIVWDLSDESPKRSAEARTRQVRRILGEASTKGPVVLIIEETHRLNSSTIRALKSLSELKWMGRGPLLSIILIGQKDPLAMPAMEEVALRARNGRIVMAGLSEAEATRYIKDTVGKVWSEEAISAVAATPTARNYLELQEALIASMDQALAEGRKRVELADAFEAVGAGLKEMVEKSGLSLSDIGKVVKKDKSTVSRVISGERQDTEVKNAIRDLVAMHGGKASEPEAPALKSAAA